MFVNYKVLSLIFILRYHTLDNFLEFADRDISGFAEKRYFWQTLLLGKYFENFTKILYF